MGFHHVVKKHLREIHRLRRLVERVREGKESQEKLKEVYKNADVMRFLEAERLNLSPNQPDFLNRLGIALNNEEGELKKLEHELKQERQKVKILHHHHGLNYFFKIRKFKKRINTLIVNGEHNVPRSGPLIIVSRHLIDQEYMLFYKFIPRQIRFVMNIRNPFKQGRSFFDPDDKGVLPRLMRLGAKHVMNGILLSEHKNAIEFFLNQMGTAMEKNDCVMIFPEGTVLAERNNEWGDMEEGAAYAIHKAEKLTGKQIPIVAMGIHYEFPTAQRTGKPNLCINIGKPFCTESSRRQTHAIIENQIKRLSVGNKERTLTYQELRDFDDPDFYKGKETMRAEMAVKELHHLPNEKALGQVISTKGEMPVSDKQKQILLPAFELLTLYASTMKDHKRSESYVRQIATATVNVRRKNKLSKYDLQFLREMIKGDHLYHQSRQIFQSDTHDQRLRGKLRRMLA